MSDRPRAGERSIFRFCPQCSRPLARTKSMSGVLRPKCATCGYVQYRNPAVGVAAILLEADLEMLLGRSALDAASLTAHGVGAASRSPAGRTIGAPGTRILLGRRARNLAGLWCIPCGYVEVDEDVREGLRREALEETGLVIEVGGVFAVHSNFHDPDRQSVGIWFTSKPVGGRLIPGDDLDALILADPADPGVPLAFPTDARVLADLAARGGLD